MGARVLTSDHHPDNFDITTTEVDPQRDRAAKTSSVLIRATHDKPDKPVWVGLKIHGTQTLRKLTVAGKEWVSQNTPADSDAQQAFQKLFRLKNTSEMWVAYKVAAADVPTSPSNNLPFEITTQIELEPHVIDYPDAQTITICVCYVPVDGTLKRGQVLLGHSLVQAPRPPGGKGKDKSA